MGLKPAAGKRKLMCATLSIKMGEHKWEALNLEYQLKESESPSEELIARVQDQFRGRNLTVY
jgi:hypothetical protein